MKEKPKRKGRTSAGIVIILGPVLTEAWSQARKLKPITLATKSSFPGQIIGVTLSFLNMSNRKYNNYTGKEKGRIKIFLCSEYHPYKHNKQKEFYNDLDSFYVSRPGRAEIIIGADKSCNIGVRLKMFRDAIGPNGLYNRNLKGK